MLKIQKNLILLIVLLALISIATLGFFIFTQFRNGGNITTDLSRPTVIQQIKSLSRLETANFTIEKVIESQTNQTSALQEILFGDKILLIAYGEVIAGIDLGQIKEENININNEHITITLPPPQILSTNLQNSKTKVYDRSQGILRRNDTQLETTARQKAEEAIHDAACEAGILKNANDNAKKQLTLLIKNLGFKSINIITAEESCTTH